MKTTHWTILAALLTLVLWASGATADDVRPGETVNGQVAGAGAVAVLDCDLAAGDELSLTLKRKGDGYAPDIAVLDPSGNTVAEASDENKAKISIEADETGTYQIRLTSNATTAPRFTLKVRGDESRKYAGRSGAYEFGVRAGSRVVAKVKAKADASLQMYDSAGDDLNPSLSGSSDRSRKATIYATVANDDYTIVFGGTKAKAKVSVTYPAPRGTLSLEMAPAPAASQSVPAAPQSQSQAPQASNAGASTTTNNNNAATGAAANAGAAATGATPAAPAVVPDHGYLTVLLAEKSDAGLAKIRTELKHHADEPASAFGERLATTLTDAIVADILSVLGATDEPVGESAIDAIIDMVEAQRRADRARAALDILAQEIPVSTLAANADYDAGRALAETELSRLDDAIAYALSRGLNDALRGRIDPRAPSYAAPAAHPASNEIIAGLAALDAAVLSGPIMTRARGDEAAAIDTADALYATYEALLNANPTASATPAATLTAIGQARDELNAKIEVDFEIAMVAMPRPDADAAYEIDIAAFGADDLDAVEYEVVGTEDAVSERTERGLRIFMAGHVSAQDLRVTARYAGAERNLDITIEPRMEEAPVAANIHGRVVDNHGAGLVGAHYEIRDPANAENPQAMGETGDDGWFDIEQVPAGEWELVIMAEGHAPMAMPLHVEGRHDDEPVELEEIMLDRN